MKRLALNLFYVALVICGAPALTQEYCECDRDPVGRASIVLADGATGSTWLGQMLDHHRCSSSFVVQSARLDGKVFINDIGELSALLTKNRRAISGHSGGGGVSDLQGSGTTNARSFAAELRGNNDTAAHASSPHYQQQQQQQQQPGGRGYGLVVAWQSVEKMLRQHHAGGGNRGKGPTLPPLNVVVLLRDPFFWVLSQQKKLALRRDQASHKLASQVGGAASCVNIHQRGTRLCPISSAYTFALDPRVLDLRLREFEARTQLMRSVGASAALKWGGSSSSGRRQRTGRHYLELDYGELMCAQEATGQKDALPRYLTQEMGLGVCGGRVRGEDGAAARTRGRVGDGGGEGTAMGRHHTRILDSETGKEARRAEEEEGSDSEDLFSNRHRRHRLRRALLARHPHPRTKKVREGSIGDSDLQPPPSLPRQGAAASVSAVKTSPSTHPALELSNLRELVGWATARQAPWLGRLSLPSETNLLNCSETAQLTRGSRPAPTQTTQPQALPSSRAGGPRVQSSTHDPTVARSLSTVQPPQTPFPWQQNQQQQQDEEGTLSPQGFDVVWLASQARMAHYAGELKRLHEEYLSLAHKLAH